MRRRVAIAALLCLTPVPAHAHLVSTGFGAYYDGMAHLLLTPQDWLLVLAMGLLAGLCGRAASRATLVALPVAWFVGGMAGVAFASAGAPALAPVLSILAIGFLVALDRRLAPVVVAMLACVAGLLHGFVNGATMVVAGRTWLALLGAATAVFVLATLLPAAVVGLRPRWTRVMVRVMGSWIAATGILMLGWILRGAR